jgi:hypothetical protein
MQMFWKKIYNFYIKIKMEDLSEDTLFNILSFFDVNELLNVKLSNKNVLDVINKNYFWCERLKKDFDINFDKDCLKKYKIEYKYSNLNMDEYSMLFYFIIRKFEYDYYFSIINGKFVYQEEIVAVYPLHKYMMNESEHYYLNETIFEIYDDLSDNQIKIGKIFHNTIPLAKLYNKKIIDNGVYTLLIDKNLIELELINISGYMEILETHRPNQILSSEKDIIYNTKISENFDKELWKKYGGKYTVKNLNGITINDLMIGLYTIKSNKFNTSYERIINVKFKKLENVDDYGKKLILELEFEDIKLNYLKYWNFPIIHIFHIIIYIIYE